MNYATFYSTNDHDSVECIPSEYRAMVKRAHELTQQLGEHDTKQALVLQTADGQLYDGIMDYKSPHAEDEIQTLMAEIGKDSPVVRLICCWSDGRVELPPADFCAKLCHFNPANKDAEMLLYVVKSVPIRSYMQNI